MDTLSVPGRRAEVDRLRELLCELSVTVDMHPYSSTVETGERGAARMRLKSMLTHAR
ncbi:hypothetical protein [Streptomyces sp. NPDC127084]|uniref:hypothetical protein n=1 Tax=Streptomyces sp. NPDC127084 TaxID=3347133 RepID=UPI0036589321